jgi:hypothetical protein
MNHIMIWDALILNPDVLQFGSQQYTDPPLQMFSYDRTLLKYYLLHLSVHLIYIELDISNHQIPLLAEDFSYALNFKTWILLWLFKSIYTCIYRIYNIPKYFIENLVLNIPIPIMSYLFSMCIVLIHPNFCVKMLIDKWNYELLVCCKSYWCYINIVIDLFSFVILNNSIKHCLSCTFCIINNVINF